MAYARFGPHSDIYLYEGAYGLLCCSCLLAPERGADVTLGTPEETIAHVREHEEAGHHCGWEFDAPGEGNRGHWHLRLVGQPAG